AVCNGELIAGGIFSSAGGVPALNLARWDGAAWHQLSTGVPGGVTALATGADGLYVSGGVSSVGGVAAPRIARRGGAGHALGAGWPTVADTLFVHGGQVHAGGSLGGGGLINRVSRWDGTAWQNVGDGLNDAVVALGEFQGELIAGGFFTTGASGSVPAIA